MTATDYLPATERPKACEPKISKAHRQPPGQIDPSALAALWRLNLFPDNPPSIELRKARFNRTNISRLGQDERDVSSFRSACMAGVSHSRRTRLLLQCGDEGDAVDQAGGIDEPGRGMC